MAIGALDDKSGKPVDWWFIYKMPDLQSAAKQTGGTAYGSTHGTEYIYCDSDSPGLPNSLSAHPNLLESGALFDTIEQLRPSADKSNIGWIFYNDEHGKVLQNSKKVPITPDNSQHGHSKGVLGFDLDTNSAFWLLHSWPAFPSFLPASAKVLPPALNFGQTFLCITLADIETLDAITKVMHEQSQPQIIEMSLPDSFDAKAFPNIATLSKDPPPALVGDGSPQPSDTTFTSKAGATFRLFAKSKDWLVAERVTVDQPKDLYSDLIGPTLKVNFEVESWQDGEPDTDSDEVHSTDDIQFIDLKALGIPAGWHFDHHDHSKWAVARDADKENETDWVIIADINRIDSQFLRGGCGIAFQNQPLARSIHSIIDMVPPKEFAAHVADLEKSARASEAARDAKRKAKLKPAGGATKKATAKKQATN